MLKRQVGNNRVQSESYMYADTEFLGFYSRFSLYYYTGSINIYTLILTLLYYSSFILFINNICI